MNDSVDRRPRFFLDDERLDQAMRQAVQDALRTHKLLGQPVVVWRDGKVVWLSPEEIPLKDEPPK